jgi:hypothetical protein
MRLAAWAVGVVTVIVASAVYAAAQTPGKPATGNPTPGTEQPAPPNLADRVTFIGCLKPAPANAGKGTEAPDPNTPSDARFVLTSAERQDRVPPGTSGSAATAAASSRTYRLEGIDSQFSPFGGAKVEVSGEIKLPPPSTPGAASIAPILLVEFVQKLAANCS